MPAAPCARPSPSEWPFSTGTAPTSPTCSQRLTSPCTAPRRPVVTGWVPPPDAGATAWCRDDVVGSTPAPGQRAWCLMSMCSRNGVRVPHVVCSRNLGPQGDGFVLGGDDEGLLDPVDVPGQVRRIGLGVELL